MKVNTELCIDLKTKLQNEVIMRPGVEYVGILCRDIPSEDYGCDYNHYTFTESTFPMTTERRNVHLYEGKYITCTKRLNGSLRLNFKNLKLGTDFSLRGYAIGVANEIREALKGYVKE